MDLIDPTLLNNDSLFERASELLSTAENATDKNAALDEIAILIAEVPDEGARELFIEDVCKQNGLKKNMLKPKVKSAVKRNSSNTEFSDSSAFKFPEDVDQKKALEMGYFEKGNCYIFLTKDGFFKASNFIVEPVLHVYSKMDNKRVIKVTNEHGVSKLLDLPSKNLVSPDLFQQSVFNEGNFIFFGNKTHFYRILSNIAKKFPIANELRTLGWQPEGFFAFSNGIYNGQWQETDEIGVCTHDDKKYFSPSNSIIYSDLREDDDTYENDRYLTFKKSPITLERWCALMKDVYQENSMMSICFTLSSIFRDKIYDAYKVFPHIFLFGEKQSGKSQCAWSMSNAFFDQLPAFNLNSGTQVGFFRRLSRVRNAICWFDEYTNDIDERRFQSLKSSYDGMGHEKGKMTNDSRTQVTRVNSSCCISGQYLPTRDDNSLLTRSVLLTFEKKRFSKEGMKSFDALKSYEAEGLSSIITEVLEHYDLIIKKLNIKLSDLFDRIKATLIELGYSYDERIIRNYASIITVPYIILEEKLFDLGFSKADLLEYAVINIRNQTAQITNSEAVSTFWFLVQYLFESTPKLISEGLDFKIQTYPTIKSPSISVRNNKEQDVDLSFDEPTKLIFFRFSKIHPLYMEAHRKQYGKNGIDLVSMLHYIKHHKAYLGLASSVRFDKSVTSAYVFDYEKLKICLEHDEDPLAEDPPTDSNTESKEDAPF